MRKRFAVAHRLIGLANFKAFGFLSALAMVVSPTSLQTAAANGDTRTLYLYHSHTKETIAATFRVNGHYDAATLEKLNYFLRDWRNDEPTKMDPRLFDVVWETYRAGERGSSPDDPIIVVSAYRCPATNAMLRRRSRAVARHSQHMLGKAMDTTLPEMPLERLREIAMRMQRGGVGFYPRVNTPFIHLDVGGVRSWPRMSYDQLARLFPDGKTVHLPSNGSPLARYAEAKAKIEARGGEAPVVVAERSGGGVRGFFASLFGGGGEDEDEGRVVATASSYRQSGRGERAVASNDDEENADVAPAPTRAQMLASAQNNLPRGETYLTTPAAAPAPARQQFASLGPTPPAPPVKPTPLEEGTAQRDVPADTPLPPRRPNDIFSLESTPTPPARPVELASLPAIITQGASASPSAPSSAVDALAYTGLRGVDAAAPVATPAPSESPSLRKTIVASLRPAARAKSARVATTRAIEQEMSPARIDRDNFQALIAKALTTDAPSDAVLVARAAGLRAFARLEAQAAFAPMGGPPSRFSAEATRLTVGGFTASDRKVD